MIRLALTVVWTAVRWHAGMAPTRLGYWVRPYCWRIDARHWVWRHRLEPSCLGAGTRQPWADPEHDVIGDLRRVVDPGHPPCTCATCRASG